MYDFEGWATKNDLCCSDGLIIRKDAFKVNDGETVPLIYNHNHDDIGAWLGHALLENRPEGVYAYCSFNDSPAGQSAKEAVKHGDAKGLSIWANNLQRVGNDILHGVIREVSLVMASANPGAFIESVLVHGITMGDDEDEAIIYTGEPLHIAHADSGKKEDDKPEEKKSESEESDKTVKDVLEDMTDEQKTAVAIIVGQAIKDAKAEKEKDDEKEDEEVKHNMFEGGGQQKEFISHADAQVIFKDIKRFGTLTESVKYHMENGVLKHAMDIDKTGMTVSTGNSTYGINDPSMLFPEYRMLNDRPEFLSRNMGWVEKVMAKVHHSPFSRIKSMFADITEDEARARGYIKGKLKKEEVFSLLKRTTGPTTVYKKQKIDRDDLLDMTGFDFIDWLKAEMRMMLNEELARAYLIGDGRLSSSDDKIDESCIRPIISDAPLFNVVVKVTVSSTDDENEVARKIIRAIIKNRKTYKGSGKPDFWTYDDIITDMLLIENKNGDSVYKTEDELVTKLRVGEIIPVDPMDGAKLTIDGKSYPLIGVICNLTDYNVGTDKGGEISMFDGFDIDYNQQKYLMETRCSGTLTKPFSALTFVLDREVTSSSGSGETI